MIEEINRLLGDAGVELDALGTNVEGAVATRMISCGARDVAAYADLIASSNGELDKLIQELSVIETWFFRDRGPFELLDQYARKRERLRVLSAGCATGEEPYSIAITLVEAGLSADRFQVHACDINDGALRDAVRAAYGARSFRESWRDPRDRWFYSAPRVYKLRPEIAGAVEFHRDDLLQPSFLLLQPPYDVVFFRNVLIYLRPEAQRTVLERIGRLLASGGIIVAGHAEIGILLRCGYEPISEPQCFACRKAGAITARSTSHGTAVLSAASASTVASSAAKDRMAQDGPILELARRLADAGDLEGAWAACERVLAQSPDADAHYLQGLTNAARNRPAAAEECFRKALYLDPAHYEALVQMSVICNCRGDLGGRDRFRRRAEVAAHRQEATHARRP